MDNTRKYATQSVTILKQHTVDKIKIVCVEVYTVAVHPLRSLYIAR